MTEKYTEIIQLVHPLFDSFFSRGYGIKFRTKEDILNHIKENKEELINLKTTLRTYQRVIDTIKKKRPNALFVIIKPAEEEKYSGKIQVAAYEGVVKQIEDYAKKKLGERAVITDFAPNLAGHVQFIKPELYSKLNKNLKLYSFGEYVDVKGCVPKWLNYTHQKLTENKITVTKAIILKNPSISSGADSKRTYLDKKILRKQELYKRRNLRKSVVK